MPSGTQAVSCNLLRLCVIKHASTIAWDANSPFGTQMHRRKSLCTKLICDLETGQWDTLINKKGSAARRRKRSSATRLYTERRRRGLAPFRGAARTFRMGRPGRVPMSHDFANSVKVQGATTDRARMSHKRPSADRQNTENGLESGFDLVKVDSGQEKCHTPHISCQPGNGAKVSN